MPTFEGTALKDYFKRILQINQSTNTGVDASTREIETGDGVKTAIQLSDDALQVKPQDDDGPAFYVQNKAGANRFAVNTSTSEVSAGANQTNVLTQYANFGIDYTAASSWSADTHYAIPFGLSESIASFLALGSSTSSSFNDTNPATSTTITTTGYLDLNHFWYLQDDITIDKVEWFSGADAATGDVLAAHLMKYDLVKDNSSTSGHLSNGAVMYDGSSVTNNGYEQIHYQDMDDQVTTASAGQVILFCVAADTVNSDYAVRCYIKYHIT